MADRDQGHRDFLPSSHPACKTVEYKRRNSANTAANIGSDDFPNFPAAYARRFQPDRGGHDSTAFDIKFRAMLQPNLR